LGVKKKYGISGDYILSVGTNEPRKNIKAVVDAFTLYQKHPLIESRKRPVELVIAGKYGWAGETYQSKAIRMTGYVDHKDLPALYSGALAFVYPSLYEGFGLPALEAMKCATPVIMSDKGSLKEIGDGAGILVSPHDVREISRNLVTLTLNDKVRKEWIQKGLVHSQKFSWDKSIDKVISIYKNLYENK